VEKHSDLINFIGLYYLPNDDYIFGAYVQNNSHHLDLLKHIGGTSACMIT
jgi:hypothetical protein